MAEQLESPEGEIVKTRSQLARRTERPVIARRSSATHPARATARPARKTVKPLRSLLALSIVGGLVAAIALPAIAPHIPAAEASVTTVEKLALDEAQSLVVASDATPTELSRVSYDATSEEEIAKKKAEEAAAARAKAAAAAAAAASAASSSSSSYSGSVDMSMTSPGSGEVRWPVIGASWASYNLFRTAERPNHDGLDMMIGQGTPIFAATSGVVRTSTDSGGGYGVVVVIDGVVGGQSVGTTYAHMIYGSRLVQAGQYVEAGQMIGSVGSTGNSTAPHLHFEVEINGSLIDPLPWLNSNAG